MNKTTTNDQNQPTISVDDITDHISKHKTKATPKRETRMKKMDVYKVLLHGMEGGKVKDGKGPKFAQRFHIMRDDRGEHIYLEETEGQVLRTVGITRLIDSIAQYSDAFGNQNFELTAAKSKECAQYWASLQHNIEDEIAPIRELSEPGYTYRRLPFDFSEGPFPLCAEVMQRTSNSRALMAFIGSLFVPDSDRQQYVWWFGDGGDSKGAITRQLARVIGPGAHWDQAPKARDKVSQFWTSSFEGKRLILFGDCNEYGFPTSGLFKSLTGGDAIRIEHKGRGTYSAYLNCKFLFLSNDKPNLSSAPADMRRVIYCESQPFNPNDNDGTYEEKIYREMPHFIYECKRLYKQLTTKTSVIETDKAALLEVVGANEAKLQWFVETYLKIGETDPMLLASYDDMKRCFENANFRGSEIKYLTAYLRRAHNVGYKNMRLPHLGPGKDGRGLQKWRYTNCSVKEPLPSKPTFSTFYD